MALGSAQAIHRVQHKGKFPFPVKVAQHPGKQVQISLDYLYRVKSFDIDAPIQRRFPFHVFSLPRIILLGVFPGPGEAHNPIGKQLLEKR